MLSKNKRYNTSEDFQSYWSEENSSLPHLEEPALLSSHFY